MKLIAIATFNLLFIVIATHESAAQEMWAGSSSSCNRQGSCYYGNGNFRPGSEASFENDRQYEAYLAALSQNGLAYPTLVGSPGGCGFRGNCPSEIDQSPNYLTQFGSYPVVRQGTMQASCSGSRCPFEQGNFGSQIDNARGTLGRSCSFDQQDQTEYGTQNYADTWGDSNRGQQPGVWYGTSPADQRPSLSGSPSMSKTNIAPDNLGSGSHSPELLPPTSTQITPPPSLPQFVPNANESGPKERKALNSQLPGPIGFSNNQFEKTADPHAGHGH